ncbi:hypothetical protein [Mycobacterium riyadhense]|uniref:hypothetical protein n=1 Tax=Mycobacterium riyadhense TaxID=486698 RepID=UPI00194E028F|nr:hypothetical protein [Mycobacterium riyadhense]
MVVGTVTAMKVAALVFYIVGFALQMVGAYLVIQDVRTSIGNMRRLKSGLADADEAAAEHRRQITEMANKPRPFGLDVAMSQLADLLADVAVEQTGPAAAKQRRALLTYVTAQNDISDRRRWVAVGLLLGGLVVGFVGNVLSLFPCDAHSPWSAPSIGVYLR